MPMPTIPMWESLKYAGRPIGVDREARVLRGYVVAQRGPFKTKGRGEFDDKSLASIVELMNSGSAGLKSRFTHPDMSSDGLGKFLGRSRNARLTDDGAKVRADLHFDPSASKTPNGDLADYVMSLAESDPDALSSSLVLTVDREFRLEPDGTRKTDTDGEPLPPLWRPKKLHASDIVDTGDAVDGLLSAGVDVDGLPLSALWRGAEMLDRLFADEPREVIEERLLGWMGRYLNGRFGPAEDGKPDDVERLRRRLRLLELEGAGNRT